MDLAGFKEYLVGLSEVILLKRIALVIIYAVFAKGADIFIDRVLRQIAQKTRISFDDKLINYLHIPICWSIFWFGILHALTVAPLEDPWQTILPQVAESVLLILWLIAMIRIFNWIVDYYLSGAHERGKIGKDLFMLMKNVLRVLVIIAGLLWLMAIWQINLTPLFASAGIAGFPDLGNIEFVEPPVLAIAKVCHFGKWRSRRKYATLFQQFSTKWAPSII